MSHENLTTRDIRIINKLIPLARDSGLRCNHVACIASKNRIHSIGFNQTKSSPIIKLYSGTENKQYIHAESDALKAFRFNTLTKQLKGCTMYSIRVDRTGTWNVAKPCSICSEMIRDSGITRVVYTVLRGAVVTHV